MRPATIRLCPFIAAAVSILFTNGIARATDDAATIEPQRFDNQPINHSPRWAGIYAGINIDALGGAATVSKGAGVASFENKEVNALLGVHLGYNFEPFGGYETGGWMWGVETDLSVGDFGSTKTDPLLGSTSLEGHFTASARVRGGFAWEHLYLYGTAGLALSDFNLKPQGNRDTDVNIGLAAGLGAELALSEGWSVRAEAIGYDFGRRKYTFNGTERGVDLTVATFRIGLSKKF